MPRTDSSRLRRNLWGVICISLPITAVSLWSFYDEYWRFRGKFSGGNFVDATGQARYEESAIWGALSIFALGVGLWASWQLRREGARRDPD